MSFPEELTINVILKVQAYNQEDRDYWLDSTAPVGTPSLDMLVDLADNFDGDLVSINGFTCAQLQAALNARIEDHA